MNHVKDILEAALEVATSNESINRERGNHEQADLETATAAEIREALAILDNPVKEPSDFGWAIRMMKQGKRAARQGWNGKGMLLWLLPSATVKSEWCREPFLRTLAEENGGEIECLGAIRMLTADKKVLTGWLASQTDMLAEDWVVFD